MRPPSGGDPCTKERGKLKLRAFVRPNKGLRKHIIKLNSLDQPNSSWRLIHENHTPCTCTYCCVARCRVSPCGVHGLARDLVRPTPRLKQRYNIWRWFVSGTSWLRYSAPADRWQLLLENHTVLIVVTIAVSSYVQTTKIHEMYNGTKLRNVTVDNVAQTGYIQTWLAL